MAEIPQIYNIAKTLYDKLINYTKKLYEFMGDEYNVPENELICELDHFFQAILFRVAVSDNDLSDIELDFIKKINYEVSKWEIIMNWKRMFRNRLF